MIRRLRADRAGPRDLLAADGLVIATPENLGSSAGVTKDFLDRCYYPALDRINGRPYALIVCAGSDGSGTVRQIERIATGWRLRKICEPLVVITGAQTPETIQADKVIDKPQLSAARNIGQLIAAGLTEGIW